MEQEMTLQLLEEHAPELLEKIRVEAAAGAGTKSFDEGVLAERVRVIEIMTADADPVQTRKAIEDGVAADAAYKHFYQAEKEKRAEGLATLQAEATEPLEVEDPEKQIEVPKDPKQKRREWAPVMGPAAA